MESVRAQVAVLSVAGTGNAGVTSENIVADSLTGAGHQIASFESVKDSETAIRSQLVGWIEDPDIDLVLVIGDGNQVSKALKPLVDQPLPGFADLLRMLAFQEIGASAMHSTAEAAKCKSTFVFVLPSTENAVRAAMEKLILPQLDPATARNLISEMPRFKEEGDFTRVDTPSEPPPSPLDSIPVEIPKEKTASGAGMPARLPAKKPAPEAKTVVDKAPEPPARSKPATQQRVKTATGKNVLVRKVEDPTKPIELQKLERQIELSKVTGDKTKPMARLPSTPPGADASEDTLRGDVKPVPKAATNTVAAKPVKRPTPALPLKPPPVAKSEPIAIAKPKPAPSLIVVEEHETEEAPPRPRPKTSPPQPPPKPQQLPTEEIEPLDADELETIERARDSVPQLSDSAIVLEEPAPKPARPPTKPPPSRPPTQPPPPPADEPKPRPRPVTAKPPPGSFDLPLASNVDLPAGNFDYKVKRSKAPLVLGLLLLVGLAIGGVVFFKNRGGGDAPRDAAAVAINDTPDASVVEPPPPPPADAAEEIEMEAHTDAGATKPPRPTTPTTGQRPTTRPTTPTTPPTTPDPPPPPPDAAVATDPGCDEPTCVIEKYARPCCVKYKPTGEPGFVPDGASDNLEKPQIRAGIDRMRPAISRCGEKHPAKGTVKISVSVNGEGVVESASVVESPDAELGSCVAALVKKATFAKTKNGGSFSYPFAF